MAQDKVLEANYKIARDTPSDIYEHIECLYTYAKQCDSIAELGVRSVVSTWAFLKGLRERPKSPAIPKQLLCCDLYWSPGIEPVRTLCHHYGIQFQFIVGDSAEIYLPPVDMLFIDTWHVYGHLK